MESGILRASSNRDERHLIHKLCSDGANYLDEDLQVLQVFATPLVEGLQQLQAVALRVNIHAELGAVRWWVLVGVLTGVEIAGGQLIATGRL